MNTTEGVCGGGGVGKGSVVDGFIPQPDHSGVIIRPSLQPLCVSCWWEGDVFGWVDGCVDYLSGECKSIHPSISSYTNPFIYWYINSSIHSSNGTSIHSSNNALVYPFIKWHIHPPIHRISKISSTTIALPSF